MNVRLRKGLQIVRTRRFPGRFARRVRGRPVVLGVGCNVGRCLDRLDRLVDYLRKSGRVEVAESSPLLKNPPFGHLDQPDFFNGILVLYTRLSPHALLRWLLWVEKRFGRKRSFPNAPRTLDLDIIFYDDLRVKSRRLAIPHPRFAERESVMIPMMFLKGEGAV